MSLYEEYLQSKGGAGATGTTPPPTTPTPSTGGLYAKYKAESVSATPLPPTSEAPSVSLYDQYKSGKVVDLSTTTTEEKTGEKKGIYGRYADQVERKVASFDAGFTSSVGQLMRSFQWLGDRLVGDYVTQKDSEKRLKEDLETNRVQQNQVIALIRKRKEEGQDTSKLEKVLKEMKIDPALYPMTADTDKGIFYKAQDKTAEWADVLRKAGGVTPENSTFSDRVFEGAGSSATYFIPALGTSKILGLTARVTPSIAMIFGGSASAGLEAMAEAGQVYDEVKKTEGAQKAMEASNKTFLTNAILLGITERFGIFNPEVTGLLKKTLLSAPTEGFQEAVQQVIQNVNTGKPTWEGVLESGAIGSIIGTVMGGTVDLTTGNAPRTATPVQLNDGGSNDEAYNAKGASGENGAYQFMPATWKAWAKQYLGNANAPMTPENQDKVAVSKVTDLLKAGNDVRKIALIWNGGQPVVKKGVNSKGVAYDSGAYADKVVKALGSDEPTPENIASAIKQVETGGVRTTVSSQSQSTVDTSVPSVELQKQIENGTAPQTTTTPAPKVEVPQVNLSEGVQKLLSDAQAKQAEIDKTRQELEEKKTQAETDETLKGEVQTISEKLDSLQKASKQSIATETLPKTKVFNGAKKVVNEVEKEYAKVLTFPNDQREAISTFAEAGDAEAQVIKDRFNYVDADKFLRNKFAGQYEAISFNNNQLPTKGKEFFDLGDGKFYSTKRELAELYAMQNREGKYSPKEENESSLEGVKKANPELFREAKKAKTVEAFIKKMAKGKPKSVDSKVLTDFYNKVNKSEPTEQVDVSAIEKEIVEIYKSAGQSESLPEFTKAEEMLAQIDAMLEDSRAGERVFTGYGIDAKVEGIPSTFPQWIPEEYRSSKLFDLLRKRLDLNNLRMPEGNKTRQRALFNILLDELDAQLGVDTSALRAKINESYGTKNNNKGGTSESNDRSSEGNQGGNSNASVGRFREEELTAKELLKNKYPNIDWSISETDSEISLSKIVVPKDSRGSGLGTKAMEDLIRYADENGKRIVLTPSKDFGASSVGRLTEFYKRLGFKENKGRTRDFSTRESMIKEPKVDQPLTGSSGNASIGRFRDDTEILTSNPENLKSIQFPELVALAKELSGNIPFIKKYSRANGMFYGKNGGEIGLNPELFKEGNLGQLSKTMAHEIGHLVDYLPDETLTRGNLMGRLSTLQEFRKDFFAPAGASRSDAELREQMWELSKYWRPIDEATATESYLTYRKSSKEIYADFISALFNNPRKVSEVAPTAYNVFFRMLDAKPEVKIAYFELQQLLRTGNLTQDRRDRVKEMFKVTEQEARERQIQEQVNEEMREKSIWFRFKTQFVDITEAVREKVKQAEKRGDYINPDDNPTYYLNERNYIGGKIKAEVDSKFNTIYQELQKDDMAWEDLGELMFYERILKGDRKEIANPLGFQPDFVQELYDGFKEDITPDNTQYEGKLSDMKSTLGQAKFDRLQFLATEYRQNLKQLFVQGREEGLYNSDLEKLFEENAFYVPFKRAKYSGTRSTFAVKQQKGTLGAIENPANSGIEKSVSIIRAIERNKVSRKTVEFLQQHFSDEVIEAKLDQNGYPLKPKEKHLDLVTYMKDGKVKGFYVDKYIGDGIKKNTVGEQNLLLGGLRFMNSRLFRPLFITFNLGFQSFNLIRDFKRFWKNVPDMSVLKAMRLYSRSLRGAKVRAFGLSKNPSKADLEAFDLITRLENEQLLAITFNDIIKGEDIEEAQIDRILRETGVRASDPKRLGELASKVGVDRDTAGIKQAIGLLGLIEKTGNMIESLPKIAGVYALEGKMEPREMRDFVRKYVGSPDFLAGGKWKPVSNEIFLFSNAIFQGIRADFEIATKPRSRSAYWFKTVQSEILPKLLMLMATMGLFGDELEKLFANVSEYDKSNYIIVPMGFDENGKTVYVRIPSDESGRLLGGLFWKMANSVRDPEKLADLETYTNLLSYAGGQVPSVTPTISTATNILTFLSGNNPYDFFRARPVLTDDQMRAGGMEKTKPFLSYLFQQMGGNVFMKLYYNETVPKDPSLSEKIVALPVVSNILGRFVRVSDYGQKEVLREITDEVKTDSARESIANRRVVFDYVDNAQGKSEGEVRELKKQMIKEIYDGQFPKTPEDRTQARSLEKRFDTLLLRGTADANIDALLTAQSNDEKVALLRQFKKTMTATEFADLQKFIIKNRVVSSDVFRRFRENNPQQ